MHDADALTRLQNLIVGRADAEHCKSIAQVVIGSHRNEGLIGIPKSTHNERLEENLNVFDFERDADDPKMT